MTEWWEVLIMGFSGGVIGGFVVYHLEMRNK